MTSPTTNTPQILPARTCVCGHHESAHGSAHTCGECGQWVEGDDRCRGCKCDSYVTACQNCGEEANAALKRVTESKYAVCSRRCLFQLDYADAIAELRAA